MRRFNPDKELYKIRYGNRNKVILGVILLLVIVSISSTFALYQVRHTKRIIYTTVSDFSKDINLAVYLDGNKQNDFPSKTENTIYTGIKCDKENVNSSWDYNDWSLILESKLPNKCNVYFETRYKDSSGASYPELYQGMIPITIGTSGELKVADVTTEWYDYDKHNWANAILIDDKTNHNKYYNEDGTYKKDTVIPITDVLQMYVWIPRYSYKLFNAVNGQNSNPQMIEIEFEGNTTGRSMGSNNGELYTHPAFLFGDTELNGFWVGKFEPSDPTDPNGRKSNVINEITILPDKTSMVIKTVKTMFDAERNIEKEGNKYNLNSNEVDTRMMKNSEWGAVAYLTSSKYGRYNSDGNAIESGAEVWINNTAQGAGTASVTNTYGGTHTGCVGESVSAAVKWNVDDGSEAKCDEDKRWNTENGVKASTTGNMYGIYDMSGGTWEYMMGVTKTQDGADIYYASSGFSKATMPDSKYYDLYEFSDKNTTHERGHLGDSTRETLVTFGNNTGSWNADYASFPFVASGSVKPWFVRGGRYGDDSHAGVFAFNWSYGGTGTNYSFRSVLSRA